MTHHHLQQLDVWDADSGALNVIIETARGSRNKVSYEQDSGAFLLRRVLPAGLTFPYDFGFIPSTIGDDDDPLDVLVLTDAPAFAGCRIPCRLIGVIEGEETAEGKTVRNDRLLAVAEKSRDHADVHALKDVNSHLLEEIKHFFVSYHELSGEAFKVLGQRGPKHARKLVEEGMRRLRKQRKGDRQRSSNGRHRTASTR
jgi:inorganic pyrophosphatase